MKQINKLALFAVAVGILVYCISCAVMFPTRGNGILTTTAETISAFERISSSGGAEVHFYTSDEYRAVVTIDENIKEYIEIFVEDNILKIKRKKGHSILPTTFTVDVYCPVLTGVSISGSGIFKNIDTITAPVFESRISGSGKMEGNIECSEYSARISGSGKINGAIECDNYSVVISGSGKITVYGNSNNVDISIRGSGKFDGNELNTKNATVNISGSGNVNICVEDSLKAKISGSGKIIYSGQPKIDSSISGSGQIKSNNN